MVSIPQEPPPDLQLLENELRRLEVEYNMYFAGARPKPPWETRSRVETLVRKYDRMPTTNTADRFRFNTIQQRFAAFVDLWERCMKAKEEGRPLPFASMGGAPARTQEPKRPAPRKDAQEEVLHVTTISDPVIEMEKIERLYESLAKTRSSLGERTVPFHRFADVIRRQVAELHESGGREIAFRASVKDGKVHLTAKPLRGLSDRVDERGKEKTGKD